MAPRRQPKDRQRAGMVWDADTLETPSRDVVASSLTHI